VGGRAPPSRLTLHYAQRVAAGDVTRGRCDSLSVALAMALLQSGSRFADQRFKRCMP